MSVKAASCRQTSSLQSYLGVIESTLDVGAEAERGLSGKDRINSAKLVAGSQGCGPWAFMEVLTRCEPIEHRDNSAKAREWFMNLQLSSGLMEVETRENVLIARFTRQVSLCGEVAEAAAEQLLSLLSEAGQQRLVVDFGNVQTLTSFMLGKLVRLNRTAEAAGGRLVLFNLTPYVRQTLEVARLNLLLSLYEDESDALRDENRVRSFLEEKK